VLYREALRALARLSLPTVAGGLLVCALPASASAATVTPQSATDCAGELYKAPTADEPNLLSYKFHCDTAISAYTLLANRQIYDYSTIDDFSANAEVVDPTGNVLSTESFGCSGQLPGNGVNCNAGAGGVMSAWDFADGQIDTADPYCANIPVGSPPGTVAEPPASIQLVVTDSTGAQDGPFRLFMMPGCGPTPKPVPKHKPKTRAKRSHHQKHRHG
jgi:hypothetical protein